MKFEMNETMAEATRLVGAGDLRLATELIQRSLANAGRGAVHGNAAQSGIWRGGDRVNPDIPAATAPLRDYLEGIFHRVTEAGASAVETDRQRATAESTPGAARPAAAPGQSSPGSTGVGTFATLAYRNAAGTRSYKLYVPAGDAAVPRPLIVMLHGCTQDPDDFAAGTRMNALAERHGFLVAYPAQPQSANNSKCWNWFNAGDQHRDRGEPSLIAGIVGDIRSRHALDADRIHLAGFSAGAAMTTVMAAEYPDLLASVAIHSGLPLGVAQDIPSALAAMRSGNAMAGPLQSARPPSGTRALRVPLIVFHGDRDTTVHPRNGEQILQQWAGSGEAPPAPGIGSGADVIVERGQSPGGRPYTRRILRGTTDRPLLEHWRLHGAGHGWSGGDRSGSHTDPMGPDASTELIRFFTQNPRRAGDAGR